MNHSFSLYSILALALLGVCLLAIFLAQPVRRWRKKRFSWHFQVLWDKKLRPHCPHCRKLLDDWQIRSGMKFEKRGEQFQRVPISFGAFYCQICTKPIRMIDQDGFELNYEEALARLRDPSLNS